MSLRQYLFLMTVGTGLCWLAWVFVLLLHPVFRLGRHYFSYGFFDSLADSRK